MKRNLFKEIGEGFEALQDEHQGKVTLKQHTAEKISAPIVTNQQKNTRELRTRPRQTQRVSSCAYEIPGHRALRNGLNLTTGG